MGLPAISWSRSTRKNLVPFSELSAVDPCSSGVQGLAREGFVACAAKDIVASSTAGVVPTPARLSQTLANSQQQLLLLPQQLPQILQLLPPEIRRLLPLEMRQLLPPEMQQLLPPEMRQLLPPEMQQLLLPEMRQLLARDRTATAEKDIVWIYLS